MTWEEKKRPSRINPQYEFAYVNRGKYYYTFLVNVLKNLGRNE